MSYETPNIPTIANPIGIDSVIQALKQELKAGLAWLDVSYGRAYTFEQELAGHKYNIPKCYDGSGEYINVLPNDTLNSGVLKFSSFIRTDGPEDIKNYSAMSMTADYSRKIDIIFWGNLSNTDPSKDYIYTERLKNEVRMVLQNNMDVIELNEYIDEGVDEIFKGYDLVGTEQQYLMYPYAGFRFNLTVKYYYPCA